MSLVIFDLDNTIVRGQSQFHLAKYFLKNKGISRIDYAMIFFWFLSYRIGLIKNVRPAMERFFSMLAGKSKEEVSIMMERFFSDCLREKVSDNAVAKIRHHIDGGDEVVILSNAMEPLVAAVAGHLGVSRYFSTRLEIVEGRYSGRIVGDIMYSKNKLETVKMIYADRLDGAYAYADHGSDIDLLSAVGHPHAVNPDRELLIFAGKNNWPVLYF